MAPLTIFAIFALIFALSGLRIAQEYQRGSYFVWGATSLCAARIVLDHSTGDRARRDHRHSNANGIGRAARDDHPRQRHVKLNAVLWYRVVDAAKSVIAVEDASAAVHQLALTSLCNSIGQHDLDEVLQKRDKINELLRQNIAGSTEAWGVEVERFEMKDVELPAAMQEVMAMQAQAIREKRAHHQGRSGT